MPKVSIIMVVYNSFKFLPEVCAGIAAQTHKDAEVLVVINNAADGSLEYLQSNYPQFKIINPGFNSGFAGGNNSAIHQCAGEFVQLVNPDLVLTPHYIENILKSFTDTHVAAVTGKLLRYDFETHTKTNVIDSTGVSLAKSGRARDRGQLELDSGQYDTSLDVFAVSGAGSMYRKSALEKVAYQGQYFDEDFVAYWEDVDLSWRLNNAGFKNIYAPTALAYHGRTAGQAKGGYLHFWNFIRHHQKLPKHIRQLNYKNHILMYLKNTKQISLSFIIRELIMFFYVLVFETSTLGVLPQLFTQYKTMKLKRAAQSI